MKGSSLGAATDIDGYYTILSVTPGVHTLVASLVGYAPMNINDVQVHIDQTTPVNVEMISQAVETGDVIVIAERNIVKKDVSTSVVAVQSEEIKTLPIASIDNVVGLQAGAENGLMVRGGGSDQLLFQIDGVMLRDPRNNKPISTIALSPYPGSLY